MILSIFNYRLYINHFFTLNLKTGVTKAHREEPLLNEAYRELADYYRTVIVPSR